MTFSDFLLRVIHEAIGAVLIVAGFTAVLTAWLWFCIWYASTFA